jgi:hypothetical protein
MNGAVKVRRRVYRLVRAVVVVAFLLIGWGLVTGERGESAPDVAPAVVEELVSGPAGGVAAELPSMAVIYATKSEAGELEVGCTDHSMAAAIVAGAKP